MTDARSAPRGLLVIGVMAMLTVLVVTRLNAAQTTPPVAVPVQPASAGTQVTDDPGPDVEPPVARVVPDLTAMQLERISFTDSTGEAGLSQQRRELGGDDVIPGMTAGLALTRWPTTRSPDRALLSTSQYESVRFWTLSDGRFVDRTEAVGLADAGRGTAAGFADLDADGDDDLVLGRQQDGVLSVWRNDSGVFHDATRALGINPKSTAPEVANTVPLVRGVAFSDVNLDGRLDFVVTDWNPGQVFIAGGDLPAGADLDPDVMSCLRQAETRKQPQLHISQTRLYLASDNGRFKEVADDWGLVPDHIAAFTPQFVDLNHDHWLDLLIAGDFCSSRVLVNDQGRGFLDATARTKQDQTPFGMGAVITDLDGDELPDWVVTGISYPTASGACPALSGIVGCSGNRVFRGLGSGAFKDVTAASGLRHSGWGWGIAAEDFGNTGDRQVAIANGYSATGAYYDHFNTDPISFFVRHRERYVDVAPLVGLQDAALGHALLPFDFDEDGRLDLLVNNSDTGLRLWRNTTPQAGRHWINVALHDASQPANPHAWGARVRVTSSGGAVTNCWITSSTSFETSWPGECHVGLGADDGPLTVQVWWPGQQSPATYGGIEPDRTVTIQR